MKTLILSTLKENKNKCMQLNKKIEKLHMAV